MITRSALSASRRIALRMLAASRRTGSSVAVRLPHERGEGPLGLGADGLGDAGRDEVQDHDRGVVAVGQGVGEAQRQLGVRAAADRDEDPPDLAGAALLDDGDVARRVADDLVDRRARRPARRRSRLAGRLAAPAEDRSGPRPARRPPR